MGIVVSFSENPDKSLLFAGWVVRQLFDDVMRLDSSDGEMKAIFEEAEAYGTLALQDMDPALANRVNQRIEQAITEILTGTINSGIVEQPFGNPETSSLYSEALMQILQLISGRPAAAFSLNASPRPSRNFEQIQ